MLLMTAISGRYFRNLARLVEERAVVFVAFDHELAAPACPIARTALSQIERNAADQHGGSRFACASSQPVSAVVVVLPCVPAMTIARESQRK